MGELSAIIGMLSAMRWNDCPRSIGIPVRNRRNPHLALLRCIDAVAREEAKCDRDERTGMQILKRALEAPTRQIAENSAVDGGVVVARMLSGKGDYGFDAARKEYVELVEAGIIDPTKVVALVLRMQCR
jgi:chaperonin GroEL (HSP60 family)